MSKTRRIAGLDGLRALSVLAVFAHHTGLTTVHGGFIGVDVFFVLSGFLITRLLRAEYATTKTISFSSFYIRRARRLFPALILFIGATLIYCLIFRPEIKIKWKITSALFYFMNWVRAFEIYDAPLTGHTWSLAIEEQFYLLWPLIIFLTLRITSIKPVFLVVLSTILVVAWRIHMVQHGASSSRIYCGFDTHSDGLLVGAFIALATEKTIKRYASLWKIGALYLIICLMHEPASQFASGASGFFWTALAAGSIISKIVTDQHSTLVSVLSDRWLAWLGTVSYGFYLWHYAVIHILLYSGHQQFGAFFGELEYPRLAMFLACFIASLIPTILSWKLIELPILTGKPKNFAITLNLAKKG